MNIGVNINNIRKIMYSLHIIKYIVLQEVPATLCHVTERASSVICVDQISSSLSYDQ